MVCNKVTDLIAKLRDIFPPQVDVSYIGTNGKCYQVALLLRHVFPQAEIHYSPTEGHVYTLIDGVYYDIDGAHLTVPKDTTFLDHQSGHRPHRWHKSFKTLPVGRWLNEDKSCT